MYDKASDELGAVLRPEMTVTNPKYFYGFRRTDQPDSELKWRPLRKSTADLYLRAQVSQPCLDRYCSALATVDDSLTLEQLTAKLVRRVRWNGQSVRALHPLDPEDLALLQAREPWRVPHDWLAEPRPATTTLSPSTQG